MKQRRTENFILSLISIASIGITFESILLGWEFWVPPLLVIGTFSLWVMNLSEKPSFAYREIYYLIFTMLEVFFHGVHETSFFDVAIVMALAMTAYSLLDHVYMINGLMVEYIIIMIIQFFLAASYDTLIFDTANVSRTVLHMLIVILVAGCCTRTILDRREQEQLSADKDDLIEKYDADMEDFLSNISHELRTPVNVVNGMSDLLIKRNIGAEAYSIKDAGIRIAYQIEDIQDYTECKSNKLIIEEDDYVSTSLINDVVMSFRLIDNSNDLELVVDLDPSVPTRMRGDIKKIHKIFRHLLENAIKFTRQGGIYIRMYAEKTEYGVNLCLEVTDTGIGIDRMSIISVSEGMYQENKKRNRNSGGIGLGLYIVYGFAHEMGGFVKIESEKNVGTTVRVTIPQKVEDESPCIALTGAFKGDILFHVRSDKYEVPMVRDFYRHMASNLAKGIHVPLYSAETVNDITRLCEKLNVTYIFMGQEEYEANPKFFDEMSKGDIVVAVSAYEGFRPNPGSRVMAMPKPLYAYPVIKLLNEGHDAKNIDFFENKIKPVFKGVRALIVDDEPMNLVVASGLFTDYEMITDTAESGKEALEKFEHSEYDIVFMDHMMPEMDGVEAMKLIKKEAKESDKDVVVVALTANAVSGAREMFMLEGFDGFIAKPISTAEFERVMIQVLPESMTDKGGERA